MSSGHSAPCRGFSRICYSLLAPLLVIAAEGCAAISPSNSETVLSPVTLTSQIKQTATTTKAVQRGLASWYGRDFTGKQTAGGASFNHAKLTAAHKTFPLGSRAKVTNLRNGKTVEVEITDRGPFVDGRVIDVSEAAAKKMGIIVSGTAPVRVELLSETARAG